MICLQVVNNYSTLHSSASSALFLAPTKSFTITTKNLKRARLKCKKHQIQLILFSLFLPSRHRWSNEIISFRAPRKLRSNSSSAFYQPFEWVAQLIWRRRNREKNASSRLLSHTQRMRIPAFNWFVTAVAKREKAKYWYYGRAQPAFLRQMTDFANKANVSAVLLWRIFTRAHSFQT